MIAEPPVVAVVGAGNMAGALAVTIARAGTAASLRLTTARSQPAWVASEPHVAHRALAEHADANEWAVTGADVVILGVKPGDIVGVAGALGPALKRGALVVSVAGGVTLADLVAVLPSRVVAVRTMPNTPVAVGRGITAYVVAAGAPQDADARVRALFAPTGTVIALPEGDIDGFSAVIGSGPAYVYYLVEAMRAAAVEQGMSEDLAARLVPELLSGSVAYLESTGREPGDLREEVTSPGGSTAAALAVFDQRGVSDAIRAGAAAAAQRAGELGRR